MRLRRVDAGKDAVAGLGDETRPGAGAQHLRADLEVDDVVGAERLDDMGFDGQVAVGGLMRDEHALRPDAERQFCAGLAVELAEQFRRKGKSLGGAFDRDARAALRLRHRRRCDVHHRAADELRDEQVLRMGVDLGRAADLLQHALMHDDDAVGEAHRLDLVVGDVDGGRALLQVQALDLGAHLLAQLGVERADRLVHQHRLGPAHQRAPDRHALHVAARQRRRLLAEQMRDLERIGDAAHFAVDVGAVLARGFQRKGDVLVDGQMRIEREGLEHEGDVAVGRLQVLHGLSVDQDVAAVDLLQPGDGAQRGRLAAARLAEHDDEFVVIHMQVEVLDDLNVAEEFLDAAKLDLSHE